MNPSRFFALVVDPGFPVHNTLSANILRAVLNSFRSEFCEVYEGETKIAVILPVQKTAEIANSQWLECSKCIVGVDDAIKNYENLFENSVCSAITPVGARLMQLFSKVTNKSISTCFSLF